MGVFRFELKQYKTSIIIWALSLSLAIMFLLPMFSGMLTEDKSSVVSSLQDNPMMEAMGISAENFFSPLGVYAFLSSFLMLAASIHAINLGLSIITKEHMQNTADFLMTKPYSRKQIFLSKMAAALCAIFIIAIAYCIGGFVVMFIVTGGGFDNAIFALLSLVFPLLQVLFLLIGVLIGVIISRVGSTLPLALGAAFGLYVTGLFSNVVNSDIARRFSPFRYFNSNYIMENAQYESSYLILYIVLLVISIAASYMIYMKKDIKMVL